MMIYPFSAETCRLGLPLCEQNAVLTVHSLHFAHTVYFKLCVTPISENYFPKQQWSL